MSSDRQLQEAVLAEFLWEPSITAAHIGVAANAGVVTLTGHVQTYVEKNAAEEAAWRFGTPNRPNKKPMPAATLRSRAAYPRRCCGALGATRLECS